MISLVQQVSLAGTASVSLTLPATPKANNVLILQTMINNASGGVSAGPSGAGVTTWNLVGTRASGTGTTCWMYWGVTDGSNATMTATLTVGSASDSCMSEWSGIDLLNPLDGSMGGTFSTVADSTIESGDAVVDSNNCLIFFAASTDQSARTFVSLTNSFIRLDDSSSSRGWAAYKIATAAGTHNSVLTLSSTARFNSLIQGFRQAQFPYSRVPYSGAILAQ